MNHYHHKKHDDSQQNSKKNIHILFVGVFNFEWNMFFLPSLHYMLFITGTKINRRAIRKRRVQFFNIIFRDKIFAICIKMIAHHSGKCIHKHLKRLAIIRILRRFFWLCSILKVLRPKSACGAHLPPDESVHQKFPPPSTATMVCELRLTLFFHSRYTKVVV